MAGSVTQAVIFAGGLGTRMGESSKFCPKPMVEIGGMPVLFHLMNIYGKHGVTNFILCLGYMSDYFKAYFSDRYNRLSSPLERVAESVMDSAEADGVCSVFQVGPWSVTLLDEGTDAMTGWRLKHASRYLKPDESFCLTYGDGLSDVNITEAIKFHQAHGKMVTVTAYRPRGRYGVLELGGDLKVNSFQEKPLEPWSNAGFFVLSPSSMAFVQSYISDKSMVWEKEPLTHLTKTGEVYAYLHHDGFWQGMDDMAQRDALQKLWDSGKAPWKVWTDAEEVRPMACALTMMGMLHRLQTPLFSGIASVMGAPVEASVVQESGSLTRSPETSSPGLKQSVSAVDLAADYAAW